MRCDQKQNNEQAQAEQTSALAPLKHWFFANTDDGFGLCCG